MFWWPQTPGDQFRYFGGFNEGVWSYPELHPHGKRDNWKPINVGIFSLIVSIAGKVILRTHYVYRACYALALKVFQLKKHQYLYPKIKVFTSLISIVVIVKILNVSEEIN
jgi:hypothetical protein